VTTITQFIICLPYNLPWTTAHHLETTKRCILTSHNKSTTKMRRMAGRHLSLTSCTVLIRVVSDGIERIDHRNENSIKLFALFYLSVYECVSVKNVSPVCRSLILYRLFFASLDHWTISVALFRTRHDTLCCACAFMTRYVVHGHS
jgi:hypothetical protein